MSWKPLEVQNEVLRFGVLDAPGLVQSFQSAVGALFATDALILSLGK
jgi:hypothetical protein